MVIIKLTRPSYIIKLSIRAKKEGLQFSKFIMRLADKELVLIQVSCLISAIYTKSVRLDYKLIFVFSKQHPSRCCIVPLFSETKLGKCSSFTAYHNECAQAVREV